MRGLSLKMEKMTTLIELHKSNGKTRRCDARCYNGRKTNCSCICGGRNHGRGFARAVQETVDDIFPELRKNNPEDHISLGEDLREPPLIGGQTEDFQRMAPYHLCQSTPVEIEQRMLY